MCSTAAPGEAICATPSRRDRAGRAAYACSRADRCWQTYGKRERATNITLQGRPPFGEGSKRIARRASR